MGKARLIVMIQFHFRSISKVEIAGCDDDITLMNGALFFITTR